MRNPSALLRAWPTAATAVLVAVGLSGVAYKTGALSDSAKPAAAPALTVEALVAERRPGYTIERRYVGRVEARRESQIGFEFGGQVASLQVEEGDSVKAGDVIATLDTQLLAARRAELLAARDRARAELKLAAITRQRIATAKTRGAFSAQEWSEADQGYRARQAALAQARSALRSLDVRLAKSRLTAPFTGVVAARYLDEGQVIDAGTPVVQLLEHSRPEVRIGVAGQSIEQLRVGTSYPISVRGQPLRGRLRALLPLRDRDTRGVDAVFELDRPLNGIRRGDLATLTLAATVPEPGFELPLTALTESVRGLWAVYVAEADAAGKTVLTRRQVQVLHTWSDRAFVQGAIEPGLSIVSRGLHRLVPGQRATVVVPGVREPLADRPAVTASMKRR